MPKKLEMVLQNFNNHRFPRSLIQKSLVRCFQESGGRTLLNVT